MSIDILNETILSLRDAAKLVPPYRIGRPVSFNCVLRWILDGSRAVNGQTVKLEAVRLGARWVTSREALARFAQALTPTMKDRTAGPAPTTKQRRKQADHAASELAKMGS